MKKITLLFSLALCFYTSAISAEGKTLTEAKFSYFYPTSSTIRDIYGSGGINYEFAFSYYVWKGLALKTAVDYFSKDGKSDSGGTKTNIRIIPVSLGPYYEYRMGIFGFYGGVGMRYFFVKVTNDADFVSPKSYGNGMGGYVEAGTLFWVHPSISIDVFANYSFRRLGLSSNSLPNVTDSSLEVGGLNVGTGIGFRF